jgi:hypothetical protein
MSVLAVRSEVRKVARLLGVKPEQLGFLESQAAGTIRKVREAQVELLFRQEQRLFERLARWFGWLPSWMLAFFARMLGPLVVARVAGELPARHAVDVCKRLPPTFLAETAMNLDPRRARDLVRRLPTGLIQETALELSRRGDRMTVGRFVDYVSEDTLHHVVGALDDATLLGAAYYLESRTHLDHIIAMLPETRLRRILALSGGSRTHAISILAILTEGSHTLRRHLGDLMAEEPDTVLLSLMRAAHEEGLWAELLPVLHSLSPEALCEVVNLPILEEPAVLESIGDAADAHDLWAIVLPLIEMMSEGIRSAVAHSMTRHPREALARMVQAALVGEHWEPLLDVVSRMPVAKQDEFVAILEGLGAVDPELRDRIAGRAAAYGFGERFALHAAAA